MNMKEEKTMPDALKTFARNTPEYERLAAAASMLTALSPSGVKYTVETIYYDFGQNWWYTTIVAHHNGDSWQALYPVHQEGIVYGDLLATVTAYTKEHHYRW